MRPPSAIWVIDFEFRTDSLGLPCPICMVAREVNSGRLERFWLDGKPFEECPISFTGALCVFFSATADLGCFLAMGWALPEAVIDLMIEDYHGAPWKDGHVRSLVSVLSSHGLSGMSPPDKEVMRELCLSGRDFTAPEKQSILDYCQSDVDGTAALFQKLWGRFEFGDALKRGEYLKAVAKVEATGIPVDVPIFEKLRDNWDSIASNLIREVDRDFDVYLGGTFSEARFDALLRERNISWPRHSSGRLELNREVFKEKSDIHPELKALYELRKTLSMTRQLGLRVGADGRCRFSIMPFRSKTGRNQPRSREFPFGRAKWFRSLIKPKPGRSIAYIDWSAQEFGIAAALSNDAAMIEAYQSGDPHLSFAIQAGAAPVEASKESHPDIRERFKVVNLGILMGMGVPGLARRLGSAHEAESLLSLHKNVFRGFWDWIDSVLNRYFMGNPLETLLGWQLQFHKCVSSGTVRNFLLQSTAADILRLAMISAVGRGVEVCCPVHDAFLIESASDDIFHAIEVTEGAMREATCAALSGFELRTSVEIFHSPDRFSDPGGLELWNKIENNLSRQRINIPS